MKAKSPESLPGYSQWPGSQPPPAKSRYKGLLIGCAGCALITVIAVWASTYWLVKLVQDDLPDVRPAAMHTGEKLPWRELGYHPQNTITVRNYMHSIDFDGDGDRELLFMNEFDQELRIVNLDGTVAFRHYWDFEPEADEFVFWDYDGNGSEEIVIQWEIDNEYGVQVLDVRSNLLDSFDNMVLPVGTATGDVDGDGKAELLLVQSDGLRFELRSQDGEWLMEGDNTEVTEEAGELDDPFLVDIDGDGIHRILYGTGYRKRLLGMDGKSRDIVIPEDAALQGDPAFVRAIDIDSDGVTELLHATGKLYLDPQDMKIRQLAVPVEEQLLRPWNRRDQLEMFDIDSDGERELICVPGGRFGAELIAFGADGTVDYHEAMAKYCAGIAVLEQDGKEHLLICAFDKVLIYP